MAVENVILNDGRLRIQSGNADDGETDGVTNGNVSLPRTASYADNSSEFAIPEFPKNAPVPSWSSKIWDDNIKTSLESLVGSQATLAERFSGGLTLLADAAVAVNVINPLAWLVAGVVSCGAGGETDQEEVTYCDYDNSQCSNAPGAEVGYFRETHPECADISDTDILRTFCFQYHDYPQYEDRSDEEIMEMLCIECEGEQGNLF